jgi:K+:H+ antiporter
MSHETALVATLAMGLGLALLFGYAATRMRIPPIVGYLLAGVAVGPFTPGFVADTRLAPQLAEIGVILLMFGVGMHFSVRDLWAVRAVALPGALAQVAITTALGAGVAALWGWPSAAGIVFGLALSVASTVVLLRALEARHCVDTPEGRIAIGWLIVEDLLMVLVLVLLPAFAGPQLGTASGHGPTAHASWAALGATIGKLVVFAAIMFGAGVRVFPWLLRQVERTGSRELFTLAVLSLAIGVAFGASELFGVSLALGAFVAGIVIHESDLSRRAAADALPLRDAFAVLFFVSVGMLFDPAILVRQPLQVLAVVAIIVFGKSLAALAIVLGFRRPAHVASTVAAGLAQIGEFSFILAGLGVSLGLLPPEGRSLILAGALLSITLNPLVFRWSDRLVARAIARGAARAAS